MNIKSAIGSLSRILLYTLFAVGLLAVGILGLVYSSWVQDLARKAVIEKIDSLPGDTHLELDRFSLRFPLRLEIEGLALTQNGDTVVGARLLKADVRLLPLLRGNAEADAAVLLGGRYVIGTPDSLMYMTVDADSLFVEPASVALSDMAITLGDATIGGGRLSMVIRPDTSAPAPPAPPTRMSIRAGSLTLRDFDYSMRLMPTIDTLAAHIDYAVAEGGDINLFTQKIALATFKGRGLDARYIVPDSAAIAAGGPYPSAAVVSADSAVMSAPWTVSIDTIAFDASKALYATAGLRPLPGLDFGYIAVDDVNLRLHDFYNRATTVRLPLALSGRERCGVRLDVTGTLDIDSVGLRFRDFRLTTPDGTAAAFSGMMGMGDLASDPALPLALSLDGAFAPCDLGLVFPAFSPYLAAIPSAGDILLDLGVSGTAGKLDIDTLELRLNQCLTLKADGSLENMMNPDAIGGDIKLSGNIINVNGLKNKLLDPSTAKTLSIPPMTLAGNVAMHRGVADGRLTARTKSGAIRLDGRWNSRREDYTVTLGTDRFPVNAFMPLLGVGEVTASLKASGHGYNPFAAGTELDAGLVVSSAVYQDVTYRNLEGKAHIAGGRADVSLASADEALDFALDASGNLTGDSYDWTADVQGRNIDLESLGMSTEPATIELYAKADATVGPGKNNIRAHLVLEDLFFRRHSGTISLSDVDARFAGADSLTSLSVVNRDFLASFSASCGVDTLATRFGRASGILAAQMASYMINIDTLSQALPPFALDIRQGRNGLINDILAPSGMSVSNLRLSADNDSILALDGTVLGFETGSMRLDSIYLTARQHHEHMHFAAGLENRPGNMDQWHKVVLQGKGEGDSLLLRLSQQNLKGDTGYDLGLVASAQAADSTITLNVNPYNPTIGYQPWTVNNDNFISYRIPDKHIDANLHMQGGNSSLALYTDHAEGAGGQEDLVVKLSDIHIADWIALNPFAPPMKGDVSADMRLNRQGDQLVGKGSAGITDFIYGREKVADFRADFDVSATPSGTIRANADLLVDGVKTITVSGALNDTTSISPMALDFSMIRFPLATVNPFLPQGVAKLSGMLNGTMDISGTLERPIVNGYLDFDSTAVLLALTGTQYQFSEDSIPVRDNVADFSRFTISGCNENPLTVDGTVDFKDLNNMKFNLAMKASNMQIVNSRKASKGADVYGKAFIDLDGHVTGSMRLMSVDAKLGILAGTNVTYVIPDATNAIVNRSNSDMVKFVSFADSSAVAVADSLTYSGMAMFLDAELNVESGTTISVDLSSDGKNKVQLLSNGSLDYTMTPLSDGRLVGRLNIDGGFVRYSQPPIISEKIFNFQNGSYVAFTGDMMNPTINVHAVDVLKANVTQTGQNSRLVNFDVALGVTGTLSQMNVAFDLSTNDDMTVANELESMTPEQRANQAMNLLLYNVYTGPGTKANASLSGNPLFSFLESQVNSWAANNIKGVDISFGIDQYDQTIDGSTSSTMRYSYQVSKSLFNDRVKIVVGGNYSTDANADENFSQNLINDISFEYFLNKTRTMYLRIFRHTGYESILEGEITQTGVGFVYRRKLRRLGDMFLPPSFVRRREEAARAAEEAARTDTSETDKTVKP